MPPITRPQGVSIGQIGQVSNVTPRAQDAGLGSILQRAAGAEFAAAQQRVNTGNEMTGLGVAQTAAGLELMKPFRLIQESREFMMAEDIGIQAKQSLRGMANTLSSSGTTPDTWGQTFQTEFTKTQEKALLAAQKVSPAAMMHVYKELQIEHLNLFTAVRTKAVDKNLEDQIGTLERKEEFTLQEAAAERDPQKRLAHKQSYLDMLDKLAFTRTITPAVAEQKRVSFEKRLLKSTTIQHAIEKGLPDTLSMINGLNVDDVEKASLRDTAEHEVRFKVKETEETAKAAEKRLKVEQSAAFSLARGKIMQESDATNLLTFIHKVPEYQRTGVLGADGDQLIGHAQARMNDLAKPNPEEDVEAIVNDLTYRIISDPGSVPNHYLFSVRGLSTATRARLEALQRDRMSQGSYKNIPEYSNSIDLFKSLDNTKVQVFNFPVTAGSGAARGSDMGELIQRAIIAYDSAIETKAGILGRRLKGPEIAEFVGYREELIKNIKNGLWPSSGKTLDNLIQ